MPRYKYYSIPLLLLWLFTGCKTSPEETAEIKNESPLFTLLSPEKTGVDFSNVLVEGLNTNVLMYEYFYNGGGVAAGDINSDGLDDIYFTSNMKTNRLYLNKGDMKFEDITTAAGVPGRNGPWKTGVTMTDINGDGRLDIYVCYSGSLPPEKKVNQLFINQGNNAKGIPSFKEEAKEYGLDTPSSTTQAFFFDYDRDGDLDAFMLNHNIKALPELNETSTKTLLTKSDPVSGPRLFNNDNGSFKDVTDLSGINSSALSYGLGAGIADINGDGWTDLYISNDYNVPDYLYINNKNGTFTDKLASGIGHTSNFSMGNDIADINNDGLPDIYTLDMLPESNHRQKLLMAPDNYGKFDLNVRIGFHYQYMRNMLQVNNGNGTFSEVGQLAGISNTDWSWAPLFADFDNDGWKDLFVTNGYLRDYTNMDFIKYMDNYIQQKGRLKREDVLQLVHQIPASNVVNYIFKNNGDLSFSNVTASWGMNLPSNSNGAAYADLDNDGDLDIIVNNINLPAFIYQNNAAKLLKKQYLKISLKGIDKNTFGLGAKVSVYTKGKRQCLEQMPSRGYQSGVSPVLHFGVDNEASIDSICVTWLSGKQQTLLNVQPNQLVTIREEDAMINTQIKPSASPLFNEARPGVAFTHKNPSVNDFKRQPLMISPMSFSGPCITKGDVNNDALEDLYMGGGAGQPGALFMQQRNGSFMLKDQPDFVSDKDADDTDAAFFDANGDGFSDLYVCSGGYHDFEPEDKRLQDRLYLNDGKGNFKKRTTSLPRMFTSTACVRPEDINGDGNIDLFVGGRVIPGRYPENPRSYVLINDGKGNFRDLTSEIAPELQTPGMITDALWVDLDKDQKKDLILAGEWMPVKVMSNMDGKLRDNTAQYFSKSYSGWWNKLITGDFNNDGNIDIVAGNYGLNSQCKASEREPAELYYKDFDNNGSVDPILCFYIEGKSYPYVSRDELLEQLGMMRPRFRDYKSYADASLENIFRPEEMKGVNHLQAENLKTTYFESDGSGKFHEKNLPVEAQGSPVFAMTALDYDKDGNQDLLLCGNINKARLRFGKHDANHGILLKGNGKGDFVYVPQQQSGFNLAGDVRAVVNVNGVLLFGLNNAPVKAYTPSQTSSGVTGLQDADANEADEQVNLKGLNEVN